MSRASLLAVLLAAGLVLAAPAVHAASPSVVVGQVYAGGGNAGAAFTNDFVELFNRGTSAVDLSGWTLQYAASTSTSWQASALTGSIAPGHRYLVQLASAGSVGSSLPAPDATGSSNLAVSGGKLAVVRDTATLSCGASAGSCSAVASVVDLVGWGSATDYEGAGAAPALSGTTAALRAADGCTDTDVNSADFSAATPTPRNSSAAAVTCGSPPAPGVSQDAAVDVDLQPVLSLTLERPTLSFGSAVAGGTPAPIGEHVTVVSNNVTGYSLTVHRSVFSPADLPLGIGASAPSGTQLGSGLTGGGLVAIPVTPAADLVLGTSAARSAGAGDVWATNVGFVSPLPVVAAGHYTATVTYTLIGR
jgi:uncharacterized protein